MRALIVDDSRALRGFIGKILKDVGFDTFEAADGLEALERLKQMGQPDVLLVDWNMPEMNGFEFLCRVRANPKYEKVSIMMVTSETEMSQMVKALEAGANEYLMKPFSKEAMMEKLALLRVLP